MVQGKWFPQNSDLTQPLALRREIFGKGRDALDGEAQQVVVYQEGVPVGTARLWWEQGAFYLGDLGVLPSYRGRGFGDLLVRLALYKAMAHHCLEVRLTAPQAVAPFFARYGFATDPHQAQTPAGVPMVIQSGEIPLGACQGCGGCRQGPGEG